jgi:hypothetical protein
MNGQVLLRPNGSFNLIVNDSTVADMYYVTGLYNDYTMEYAGTAIEVGGVFWSNQCTRYVIDSIIAAPGSSSGVMKLRLSDPDEYGMPGMGIGAVMMETPGHALPTTTANLSEPLQGCIQTHFAMKSDTSLLWSEGSNKIYRNGRVAIGDTTGTAMLKVTAEFAIDSILGPNVLVNGGFADTLNGWGDYQNLIWDAGVVSIDDPGGDCPFLQQDGITITEGERYLVKLFLGAPNDGSYYINFGDNEVLIPGTGSEYTAIFVASSDQVSFSIQEDNDCNFSLDSIYVGILEFENDTLLNVVNSDDSTAFMVKQDGEVYVKKGINIPNPDNYLDLNFDVATNVFKPGPGLTATNGLTRTLNNLTLGGTISDNRVLTFDGATTASQINLSKTLGTITTFSDGARLLYSIHNVGAGTMAVNASYNTVTGSTLAPVAGTGTGLFTSTGTASASQLLAANQNRLFFNSTGYDADGEMAFSANVNTVLFNSSADTIFTDGAGYIFGNLNIFRSNVGALDTLEAIVLNNNIIKKASDLNAKTVIMNNASYNLLSGTYGSVTNVGYHLTSHSSAGDPLYLNPSVTGNYAFASDISGWKGYINGPLSLQTPSNHASAVFEAVSTTQGFLMPRMTLLQLNAISSPATGLMVINTSNDRPWYRTASNWQRVLLQDDFLPGGSNNQFQYNSGGNTFAGAANLTISGSNIVIGGTPTLPATFTMGANSFIRSGAHNLTLTTTGTTSLTLPTGPGTLALTTDILPQNLGTITNGFIPKAMNDTLVNSMIFETTNNVAIGTSTNIDAISRLYVYGGNNGANVDVRPAMEFGDGYPQAIIDLQSKDYSDVDSAGFSMSTYLVHYSGGAFGTTMGLTNEELGLLNFAGGSGGVVKSTFGPLLFGYQNNEAFRVETDNSVEINTVLRNRRSINAQSGTSYTLVLTDEGRVITLNNGASIALTVPQNSSVAFPIGTQIDLIQIGPGQVTVAGSGSAVVNGANGLKIRDQYSVITLLKIATDSWIILGDTEP